MKTPPRSLIDLDARYEALARLATQTYTRYYTRDPLSQRPVIGGSRLAWALWRLRVRWARERTRLLMSLPEPTLGLMARHLVPLPCAPTLADPDPNALQRWDDDGGRRRVCPSHPCDCPDCE